jgi:SAM-dependent methyltransferase
MALLMAALDLSNDYVTIDKCRICNSSEIKEILDLGIQPLANNLREIADKSDEKKFPLILMRCKNCTSIQLSVNVNPRLMFQDYLWVTGTAETARKHCENLAQEVIKYSTNTAKVLEIGSNDGTLLKEFRKLTSGQIHGVDPAKEISHSARADGINIHADFFNLDFAINFEKEFGKVNIVIARNVLSHVPDLINVMNGIDKLLSEDGLFIVEFHEASRILIEIHYDSIYHEHTFYHSINSMTEAQSKVGLIPFDIMESPISGGSFVLISSRSARVPSQRLLDAIKREESLGVLSEDAWRNFATLAKKNLEDISDFLKINSRRKIRAFGASARSSTLMNAIGEKAKYLEAIADNNPLKWGKLSPGNHLRIDSPKIIIQNDTEIVFICPFNFEDEIIKYLKDELNWHGEVFLPLPGQPRVYAI